MRKKQHSKIITWMVRHPDVVWWVASDFMQQNMGEYYCGYEASARLSELGTRYPQLIETRRHPVERKYFQRRIRWEAVRNPQVLAQLPDDLRHIVVSAQIPRVSLPTDKHWRYESISRPGTWHTVTERAGALSCDCEAYHFCKAKPQWCKHTQNVVQDRELAALPLPAVSAPAPVKPPGDHWHAGAGCKFCLHRGRANT